VELLTLTLSFPCNRKRYETLATENHRDKNLILVADGLGYGDLAQEASPFAVRVFRENAKQGPKAI
jgi:hypothetical protein